MSVHSPTTAPAEISPSREKFDRWLHHAYFRTAGIRHFIARRIRPAGIAVGFIFVLAGCLGAGHELRSTYQLFSLSLAMMLIGMPCAMMRRAKLTACRELPRYGTAGESLRYLVTIKNIGKRGITRAWLSETPPDPRPDGTEFSLLREPGEEERNSFDRRFAYFRWQWLLLRKRLFAENPSQEELRLKSGQQTRLFLEITPLRRGVIRLDDLRVILPDPFALFQKCADVHAPAATLMVLPRRYALPTLELPGGAAFKISGDTNTNTIGNSGEFVGLRDYRPGDPMRQIHWKSWARAGRPIVKELEDTHYPRYGLILDTLSTDRSDVTFEEAVSVAASFASSIDTRESLLDLLFVKNEAHKVTVGRGLERAEKLLEVLAGVTPERTAGFEELAQLVLSYRNDLSSCIVIFNGWDDLRADFLNKLKSQGVLCTPIIIGVGPSPSGVPGHWLESGHIARDLKQLPNRLSTEI